MDGELATMSICKAQIPIAFPFISMHVLCCVHFRWLLVFVQESIEIGDELRHGLASR